MVCHFEEKIQKKLGQRDKKLKYPLNYSLIRKFRVTYKNSIKENGLSNFFPLFWILSFAYKSFIKTRYKSLQIQLSPSILLHVGYFPNLLCYHYFLSVITNTIYNSHT